MKDLKELRDQIDVIDRQIVDLYQERMEIALVLQNIRSIPAKKYLIKNAKNSKLAR